MESPLSAKLGGSPPNLLVLCSFLPIAMTCGAYSHCNFGEKYVKSMSRQVPDKFLSDSSKMPI